MVDCLSCLLGHTLPNGTEILALQVKPLYRYNCTVLYCTVEMNLENSAVCIIPQNTVIANNTIKYTET